MPLRLRHDLPLFLVAVLIAWGGMSMMPVSPAFAEEEDEEIEFMEDEEDHDEDEEHEHEEFHEEHLERELAGFELYFAELEAVTRILDVVQQMTEIAKDPDSSAIAAVLAVNDFEEEREQADFLQSVLDQATSETVKRAIRLRLIDVYKHTDQIDKAAEQARLLIVGHDD